MRIVQILSLAGALLFGGALSGCAEPQLDVLDAHRAAPIAPDRTFILPTRQCGHYFIADITIDGAGPFAMLLDTGAPLTTLSPTAARQADVRSRMDRLEFGELIISGRMRCQVRELDHIGDALGEPIDGILGHPVFRKLLLTYDYPAGEIRARIGALEDDLPGVAPMSTSTRPFLGAMVGDRKINVLLDTGSTSALTLDDFDRLAFQEKPVATGMRARLKGHYLTRAGRLRDDVRFGAFLLEAPIVDNAIGVSLLGQAILRDYVVTIDQQRGRVQIIRPDGGEATDPIPSPSLYGPGWALRAEADAITIVRVFDGTAADRAGFESGDRLLTANGIPIGQDRCTSHEARDGTPTTTLYRFERDGVEQEVELRTSVLVP